ncbi:hypothetical protein C4579_01235 [Candidatus Microgenomates bacterium]|nr:MAG: hypothetical protein C4579_01235 [Candidatus Microgenomates bacterium]
MKEILSASSFQFPYTDLHFPGLNTGERILFVTRESKVMLYIRLAMLTVVCVALFVLGGVLVDLASSALYVSSTLWTALFVLLVIIAAIGYFWIYQTYKKSVFIITTRRLTKIIYTTPFTWYQFSLGLDEIQDTGSYASTFFEVLFRLGYFVARSGAGAIKNFKIVNISFAADLHNYVNKLLYAFKHHSSRINEFRPFIPHVKGELRKELLKNYPDYRTEF